MIIFVGSNPAKNTNNQPFGNCKSGDRLRQWISMAGIDESQCLFANVYNLETEKNKKPSTKEAFKYSKEVLLKDLDGHTVVAVGKFAGKILGRLNVKCLQIEHPSGLNRNLNNPEVYKKMIDTLSVLWEEYTGHNK